MGVGSSKQKWKNPSLMLQPNEVDWDEYTQASWRSEISRELDKYGGISRPAIPRGGSVTAKLQFLQLQVGKQAEQIQAEFTKSIASSGPAKGGAAGNPGRRESVDTVVLRSHLAAGSITGGHGDRASRGLHHLGTQKHGPGQNAAGAKPRTSSGIVAPAEWRLRVHAARRRTIMTVLTSIRLRAGLKHPKRLRRVDSFSFFIPGILQEDLKRFVTVSQRYKDAVARIEAEAQAQAAKAAEEEKQAAEAAAAAAAPSGRFGARSAGRLVGRKSVVGESGRIVAPESPSKAKLRSTSSNNPTPEPGLAPAPSKSGQLNASGLGNGMDKDSTAGSAPVSPVKGAKAAANGAASSGGGAAGGDVDVTGAPAGASGDAAESLKATASGEAPGSPLKSASPAPTAPPPGGSPPPPTYARRRALHDAKLTVNGMQKRTPADPLALLGGGSPVHRVGGGSGSVSPVPLLQPTTSLPGAVSAPMPSAPSDMLSGANSNSEPSSPGYVPMPAVPVAVSPVPGAMASLQGGNLMGSRFSSPSRASLTSLPAEQYARAAAVASSAESIPLGALLDPVAQGKQPGTIVLEPIAPPALQGHASDPESPSRLAQEAGQQLLQGGGPSLTKEMSSIMREPEARTSFSGTKDLGPVSKFGFTPAYQRALAPRRMKEMMNERRVRMTSDSGAMGLPSSGASGGLPWAGPSSDSNLGDLGWGQQLQGVAGPQGHIHLTYTASSPGGVQGGGTQEVSEQQALELAQALAAAVAGGSGSPLGSHSPGGTSHSAGPSRFAPAGSTSSIKHASFKFSGAEGSDDDGDEEGLLVTRQSMTGGDDDRSSSPGPRHVSEGGSSNAAMAAAGQLQGLLRAGESSDYFGDADADRVTGDGRSTYSGADLDSPLSMRRRTTENGTANVSSSGAPAPPSGSNQAAGPRKKKGGLAKTKQQHAGLTRIISLAHRDMSGETTTTGVAQLIGNTSPSRRQSEAQQVRIAEEAAADTQALAQEILEAKEAQRKEEEAAAQKRLEDAWEAEFAAAKDTALEKMTVATPESFEQLLAMYVNRGNSCWAAGQKWCPPALWDSRRQEEWMASEEWNFWKARLAHSVRAGGVAVQIHAFDESLQVAQGSVVKTYDLWHADPWDVLYQHRPQAYKDRVPGIPWGARILTNLAVAAEALGGKDGARHLTVLLHLAEDQVEKTLQMLTAHNFCGLEPRNLLVFIQRKRHGYTYAPKLQRFVRDTSGPTDSGGSGISLMSLNWVAEGYGLDKNGRLHVLMGTALEALLERKVEWLVSHRASDIGLLSRESCLDLVLLPFCMAAHKVAGVAAATQVVKEEGLGPAARRNGSVVLGQAVDKHRVRATLSGLPPSHPASGLWPVAELRAAELHAGSMKDIVRAGKHSGLHYLMGLDRYIIRVEELRALLVTLSVMRPKLVLAGAVVHVRMDMGDVMSADSLRTLAVKARLAPHLLTHQNDLDDLLPVLKAQDAHQPFRKAIGPRRMPPPPAPIPISGLSSPGGISASAGGAALDPGSLSARTSAGTTVAGGALSHRSNAGGAMSPGRASPGAVQGSGNSFTGGNPLLGGISAGGVAGALSLLQNGGGAASPAHHLHGHNLVVFVSNNNVSQLAVEAALAVARPGRDIIHLVTVVSGLLYVESAQALLEGHYALVARALMEARQEVLVLDKEEPQLISTMESYVRNVGADLVVMATKALNTAQLQSSTLLGSVTLAAIKRLSVPVLVVNSNSLNVQEALRHHCLRAMAMVNRHSQPLVAFLCSRVLQPQRGDSLVLCQVEDGGAASKVPAAGTGGGPGGVLRKGMAKLSSADQATLMLQRLMMSLNQAATMAGLAPPLVVTTEDSERVEDVARLVAKEGIHLLGYLLPPQVSVVPQQLVLLMHTARCAVLVFKQKPGGGRRFGV